MIYLYTSKLCVLSATRQPMDREGLQYWKLPVAMKTDSRQTSSILYTIPTNQNPTGTTMTDGRRRDLLNFCVKKRLPIIEDGAYHELCCDFQPPVPIKAMDKTGNVIYIGSASKTLAPGLRIGWLVATEPVAYRLGDVKMQTDYGASSISQWIFAEFLSSGLYSQYLKSLKRELQKRRDSALATLENCFKDIADWNTPSGGFYIWLTFKKRISMDSLFEKAARAGILLNPGDIYDFGHNNSLRLSYAYASCEEFKMAAEKLAGLVGALTFD